MPPTTTPGTGVEPSPKSKVTVPVGVPAPGAVAVTVAVAVTCSPTRDGSGDDVTTVVVADWFTVWVSVPTDGPKLLLPV